MKAPELLTPPRRALEQGEYQDDATGKLHAALRQGPRSPLLVAPTVSGKAEIAAEDMPS